MVHKPENLEKLVDRAKLELRHGIKQGPALAELQEKLRRVDESFERKMQQQDARLLALAYGLKHLLSGLGEERRTTPVVNTPDLRRLNVDIHISESAGVRARQRLLDTVDEFLSVCGFKLDPEESRV